jgi:2-oxoglutarate ferredoxin oxidoreductase subunit beta
LKKLEPREHDPRDKSAALKLIEEGHRTGTLITGLLYVDPDAEDFSTRERLPAHPLRDYTEAELRLTREQFEQVMADLA